MVPYVIITGSDRGGVGKTTCARVLVDYFKRQGVTYRAFDTESPLGVLQRFHPDKTQIVDLTRSDDQMKVFDNLRDAQITLIDIRAGLLSKTLRTLSEIGFLDGVKQGKLKIAVLHVIGSSEASFQEIKATAAIVEGAKHWLVVNHATDASFLGLSDELKKVGEGVIDIGKLNDLAAEHVDNAGVGFDTFVADEKNSAVLRGYVRAWLHRAFQQFDSAHLTQA
jgi:hypothetical protein